MRLLAVCALLLAAAPAHTASASPVPTRSSTTTAATHDTPQGSEVPVAPVDSSSPTTYSYNVDGRRDPFQSLTGGGKDSKARRAQPSSALPVSGSMTCRSAESCKAGSGW